MNKYLLISLRTLVIIRWIVLAAGLALGYLVSEDMYAIAMIAWLPWTPLLALLVDRFGIFKSYTPSHALIYVVGFFFVAVLIDYGVGRGLCRIVSIFNKKRASRGVEK